MQAKSSIRLNRYLRLLSWVKTNIDALSYFSLFFTEKVMRLLKTEGIASRGDYFINLITTIATLLGIVLFWTWILHGYSRFLESNAPWLIIITIVGVIYTIFRHIAVAIRRCHDLGWNGFNVIWYFIPVINLYWFFMLLFAAGKSAFASKNHSV